MPPPPLRCLLPRFVAFCFCGAGFTPAISAPSSPTFTLAFELPGQTGIIEGIAHRDSTGDFFFGDVHHRCIWRRDRAGRLTRFSPPGDVLYGVFGLAIDEPRHLLWAATSMVSEAAGFAPADEGRAALVALDLATGRIVQTHALPADTRNHVLGDLLLAPDGTVYVTDSLAPVVWRLAPKSSALEPFLESPSFRSLQGLALVSAGKKLVVSDYSRGLFAIDIASGEFHAVTAPANTDLRGLDGLLAFDGAILAVQNATRPNRILRLTLSAGASAVTRVETLAAIVSGFDDLTLITLAASRPHVIANSGWSLADPAKSPTLAPHPVRIFSLPRHSTE